MTRNSFTRRAIVIGAATVLAAPAIAYEAERPLPQGAAGLRIRAVRLDVRPLAAHNPDVAAWLAADMAGPLQQAFAARLTPGAAGGVTVVARIDRVNLVSWQGGGGFHGGGPEPRDVIEGAGVVLDGAGREIAVYPLFTQLRADEVFPPAYRDVVLRRRTDSLGEAFAYWLPGRIGL